MKQKAARVVVLLAVFVLIDSLVLAQGGEDKQDTDGAQTAHDQSTLIKREIMLPIILVSVFALLMFAWIACWVFLRKTRGDNMHSSVFIGGMTVIGVLGAVVTLALTDALDEEAVGVLLSSIVGYILGRHGRDAVGEPQNER